MQAFQYAAPTNVSEALELLAPSWGNADILAGGTDLLSLLKERVHTPTRVVSLKKVSGLGGISKSSGMWRIGSMAALNELLTHAEISKEYPALIQAAEGISSPQMRAMGTVGGELLQRPRCWYFRNGFGILAQDSSGKSLVPDGENRYHAILGNKGPAYFVNASSLAPALIALGAKVKVASSEGERELEVEKLYQAPKTDTEREVTIKANEIVTEILIPSASSKSATYEVRQRQLMDWPLTTASVSLKMNGSTVESARVVMGHVAPTPWRSSEAEKALAGKSVSEQVADEAGKAALAMAKPLSGNKYKVQLARTAVKRAIMRATA